MKPLVRMFISFVALCTFALLALFYLPSCSKKQPEAKEIKIGVILSLTGTIAPYGESALQGVKLAVSEINEKGGISNQRLEIIIEDDQSEPKIAVSAVRKLVFQDKVPAVVGFIGSSLLLATAPIFEKNQTVLISPGASSPQIREAGEFIFRTRASGRIEAVTLAKYAVENLGCKNIAVLYVNNDYGLSWLDYFSSQTVFFGGHIVKKEAFDQGARDLRSQLSLVKNSNATCLLILGYLDEIAVALRQVAELGLNLKILTTVGIQDKKIFELVSNSAEGVYFCAVDYDPADNPISKAFDKAYMQMFHEPSNIFAANAYDAVNLLANTLGQVGTDGNKIKSYLLSIRDYDGAGGKLSFDEKGDVIKPVKMKQIQGEKFVTINY